MLPPLQIFAVVILTSSIVTLLLFLRKQAKQSLGRHDEFRKEIINLIWILILFDASYVLRGIYDYLLISSL